MPGPIGNGPRPYLNASIDELAGFVAQHRMDPKELKRILGELDHRSAPKARKLKDHVRTLIAGEGGDDLFADIQPSLPIQTAEACSPCASLAPPGGCPADQKQSGTRHWARPGHRLEGA